MKRKFDSKQYPGFWMNRHGVVFCPPAVKHGAAVIGRFALLDFDQIFADDKMTQAVRAEAEQEAV
jgi:hypothetical protein